MATAPPFPTQAPAREVWRLSLSNAARQTNNYHGPGSELASRAAVGFAPEYPAVGTGTRTFDPCDANGANITYTGSNANTLAWFPWGVAHVEECPTLGGDVAGTVDRARNVLGARTSDLVERVLWNGTLDVGTSIETMAGNESLSSGVTAANRRLASSSATLIDGSSAHDLTVALGLINEWAADTVGPYRVWIHGTPELAPFLAFYGQAVRTDARSLESALGDHRFVLGSGYDESSSELTASAGEAWLVVTNPVAVVEGDITPPVGADPQSFVYRATNRTNVVATRGVLAFWDTTVHAAIKVCLPAPGPACS